MKTVCVKDVELNISGLVELGGRWVCGQYHYPRPKEEFDSFNAESTMSKLSQMRSGLFCEDKQMFLPVHVTCGVVGGKYFFEYSPLEGLSGEAEGEHVRFLSALQLGENELPGAIPDSLLELEEKLCGFFPEYREAIHSFLIDLFAEHLLMFKYSDCLATCHEYAEDLYKLSKDPKFGSLIEECRFIVDDKWVSSDKEGTHKLNPYGEVVGFLSPIVISCHRNVDAGEIHICMYDTEKSYQTPIAAFSSLDTLPDTLPEAVLGMVHFIPSHSSDSAQMLEALMLGRVGWELFGEQQYSGCLNDLFDHMAELYEDRTGWPAPRIKTNDKGYDLWEEEL